MSTNSSSQCQLFQLHIDACLDGELEPARAAELQSHVQSCQACSQELAYAERLHRAVVSLPILDCSDHALEPVDRLFRASDEPLAARPARGFWAALGALLDNLPLPVRVAVPVAVALLVVAGPARELLLPAGTENQVAVQPAAEVAEQQYSPAEIRQAMQELELALDYLGKISERTEVMIEDRFLLRQLKESMSASFTTDPESATANPGSNGPI